jgi:hypothetical protein
MLAGARATPLARRGRSLGQMSTPKPEHDPAGRLKTLLDETGYVSWDAGSGCRGFAFPGRAREWLLVARLTPEWCYVWTYVCDVPSEPGLRARLLAGAMEENGIVTAVKFSVNNETRLVLEIEYRTEHVDAATLGSLARYLQATAERMYPKVFRIVSGDDALAALETTLAQRDAG